MATFSENKEFPAFYTRTSGCYVPYNFKTAREAAQVIFQNYEMNIGSGQLIAVPIPKEYEMDHNIIEEAIDQALAKANKNGIKGKEITPFLLSSIADVTQGKSLESSILYQDNSSHVFICVLNVLQTWR